MNKQLLAKVFGAVQFFVAVLAQVSNGHFPQTVKEWGALLGSAAVWVAVHHAASTDGVK